MLSRLEMICKDMKKDIEDCYNGGSSSRLDSWTSLIIFHCAVLNAQEKRSVGIKFLKASMWNKELASYATRFTNRRADLTFALSMRSVVTMEEMNSKCVFALRTLNILSLDSIGQYEKVRPISFHLFRLLILL